MASDSGTVVYGAALTLSPGQYVHGSNPAKKKKKKPSAPSLRRASFLINKLLITLVNKLIIRDKVIDNSNRKSLVTKAF